MKSWRDERRREGKKNEGGRMSGSECKEMDKKRLLEEAERARRDGEVMRRTKEEGRKDDEE